jgi:hypothetical protein
MQSASGIFGARCDFAFADEVLAANGAPQAQAQTSAQVAKIKRQVQKRGAGEKSRVKITLTNASEIKGYISKIDVDSFAVTDQKGQVTTVSYSEVQQVQGPGLIRGAKIGITAAVIVGVLVVVVIAVKVKNARY